MTEKATTEAGSIDGAASALDDGLGAWLPIDTAPVDGSVVEIRFFRTWVHTSRPGETQDWYCRARYEMQPFGGWRHADDGQAFSREPTHWRAERIAKVGAGDAAVQGDMLLPANA